jgi:hypothetical protein
VYFHLPPTCYNLPPSGTVSLPFEPGPNKRIAVKVIDDRGIESLKVVDVK